MTVARNFSLKNVVLIVMLAYNIVREGKVLDKLPPVASMQPFYQTVVDSSNFSMPQEINLLITALNVSNSATTTFSDLPDLARHYWYRWFSKTVVVPHGRDGDDSTTPLIAIATVNIQDDPEDANSHPYFFYTRAMQSEYASRHGYDFYALRRPFEMRNSTRTNHYQKILSTQYLLDFQPPHHNTKPYDYIFWMDADTMIMNMSKTLEAIVESAPPNKHAIICGDTNVVNSAQLLWKNTKSTRKILQDLWDMYDGPEGKVPIFENGLLASMIAGCTPQSTPDEKLQCYESVDFYTPPKRRAQSKRISMFGDVSQVPIAPWAKDAFYWVPKRTMNSYAQDVQPGDFVFHAVAVGGHKKKPMWLNRKLVESLEFHNMTRDELLSKHNFSDNCCM